ncbi:MAG: transporter [Bacteroidetes bacterium]|nr:transporter [Bacteroidota bacterium]
MKFPKFVFLITLFSSEISDAQDSIPIQTDRPDQTESPFIVSKRHIQFENGFLFEKEDKNKLNYIHPTILTRIGINNIFELRLITETVTQEFNNNKTIGFEPIRAGFKTKLADEKGIIPTTAFIGHLRFPFFLSDNMSKNSYFPDFRFTMQHTINKNLTLGYNLGAQWDENFNQPNFLYTITTGYSISENFGTYIELYGFVSQKTTPDHRFDTGYTYIIKNNIMLDLSGGLGISQKSPSFFVSLGLSFRMQN